MKSQFLYLTVLVHIDFSQQILSLLLRLRTIYGSLHEWIHESMDELNAIQQLQERRSIQDLKIAYGL